MNYIVLLLDNSYSPRQGVRDMSHAFIYLMKILSIFLLIIQIPFGCLDYKAVPNR